MEKRKSFHLYANHLIYTRWSCLLPKARNTAALAILFVLSVFQGVAQPIAGSSTRNDERAEALLSQMTLEEKIDLLGGIDFSYVRGVPRLGVPRLKMADGPLGVRSEGQATCMAAGIALAATWNATLARQVGLRIGEDARARGVHFLLGPGLNIYRSPLNGRNFEYFGEDPFLASRIAVGFIEGVQSQGVSATAKHFMGNNSEYDRHNEDSIIDERAMHEIYLPAFEAAVREAKVGALMDSYNLTNGAHMSENGHLNNDVVKQEWGFNGLIMSDWFGTYDGVAAANAGLDLEMPYGRVFNRKTLLPAVQQGTVSQATIDDKVRRILRVAARFGWLDHAQIDLSVPLYDQQAREVALEAARQSMVLLKNEGDLLPLSRNAIKSIAVFGPDAYPAVPAGGGSARVVPFHAISFLEGISNYLGAGVPVYYDRGIPTLGEMAKATSFFTSTAENEPGLRAEYFEGADLNGTPVLTRTEAHANFDDAAGKVFPERTLSGRWTGYYHAQRAGLYDVFVESTGEAGGYYRLYVDGQLIFDNWTMARAVMSSTKLELGAAPHKFVLEHRGRSGWLGTRLRLGVFPHDHVVSEEARALAAKADVVVVAVGFDPETESEGGDRTFQLPPGQEQLIREMQAVNKNVVVVITSGGAVAMDSWIDHVPAVLQAWYPGQEGGTALAEILFGAVNPSGRLPVTFERRWEDNPVYDSYYPQEGTNRVVYKEGVFVGYRGYEHNHKRPLFPFGHGLSYTKFTYSHLSIAVAPPQNGTASEWAATVSFDVANTGKRDGDEVAQVYVADGHSPVARPEEELKGFVKVHLKPGEKRRVQVKLDERALSYYEVKTKTWRASPGLFTVLVGSSSRDIRLQGAFTLPAPGLRLAAGWRN